jgi:hypothetical protein
MQTMDRRAWKGIFSPCLYANGPLFWLSESQGQVSFKFFKVFKGHYGSQ